MKILLSKVNYRRRKEYLIQTNVVRMDKLYVEKTALGKKSWDSLLNSVDLYLYYAKKLPDNIKLSKCIKVDKNRQVVRYKFIHGVTLESQIEKSLLNRDFQLAKELYQRAMDIISQFEERADSKEIKNLAELFRDYTEQENFGKETLFVRFTELTTDHLIYSPQDGRYYLIDYENFLGFKLPSRYVKFRAELYLISNLQQLFKAIVNRDFILVPFWKGLYIPKEWVEVNNISLSEKRQYLYLENKLQNMLYWYHTDYDYLGLTNYKEKQVSQRILAKITTQQMLIFRSTVARLWRIRNKAKKYLEKLH